MIDVMLLVLLVGGYALFCLGLFLLVDFIITIVEARKRRPVRRSARGKEAGG